LNIANGYQLRCILRYETKPYIVIGGASTACGNTRVLSAHQVSACLAAACTRYAGKLRR
jgi:hypothetical protein